MRATEAEQAQLRVDIAHLRVDLGDTIAELTERVDVPARVKAQTSQTTNHAPRLVTGKKLRPSGKQHSNDRFRSRP